MLRVTILFSIISLFCARGNSQSLAVASIDSLVNLSILDKNLNGDCSFQADSLQHYLPHLVDSFQNKYIFYNRLMGHCLPNVMDSLIKDLEDFKFHIQQEEDRLIRKQDFLHTCSQGIITQQVRQILSEESEFKDVKFVFYDLPLYFGKNSEVSPYITIKLIPFVEAKRSEILIKWTSCQEVANKVKGQLKQEEY